MMQAIIAAIVGAALVYAAGACAGLFDRPAIDLDFTSPNTPREQEPEPRRRKLFAAGTIKPRDAMDELAQRLTREGARIGYLPPQPILLRVRRERQP